MPPTFHLMAFAKSLSTFPVLLTDQGCHATNQESRGRFEPRGASEKVGGEVWQCRMAPNTFGLGRNGNRWRGLLSNPGAEHGIDCGLQRGAVDWCEFDELFDNRLHESFGYQLAICEAQNIRRKVDGLSADKNFPPRLRVTWRLQLLP